MRELVYDIEWQAIRVHTLAVNRTDGGWTTEAGTRANIKRLREYVADWQMEGQAITGRADLAARYYRVINMLNATRMGNSGQGRQGSTHDEMVRRYRDECTRDAAKIFGGYRVALTDACDHFSWSEVTYRAQRLYDDDPSTFKLIYESVALRSGAAKSRGRDVKVTRPELVRFIDILERVADSHV